MYDRILLPTDGSKNSERAIIHAVRLADKHDAEIIILNAVDSVYLAGLPEDDLITESEIVLEEESTEVTENVKSIIKKYSEEYDLDFSKVKLTSLTVEGDAGDKIIEVSEKRDIDIIVIASSGKHRLDRFLLGSVTEKIVHNSKVPILVIPNTD